MTDEQLQALQDKIMKSTFDEPEELENMIKDTTEKVARDLAFKASEYSEVEFQEKHYKFQAIKKIKGFKEYIFMVISCHETYEEAKDLNKTYLPYTMTAEINNGFSYVDNMKSLVEAFFRHITGDMQVGELPD